MFDRVSWRLLRVNFHHGHACLFLRGRGQNRAGMWRRCCRDFTFTLGSTASPAVGPFTERMEVSVEEARARISYGSHLTASLLGISSYGYLAAGLEAPAGSLYRLPLVTIPATQATMSVSWILGSGQDPNLHHLYPTSVPPVRSLLAFVEP